MSSRVELAKKLATLSKMDLYLENQELRRLLREATLTMMEVVSQSMTDTKRHLELIDRLTSQVEELFGQSKTAS